MVPSWSQEKIITLKHKDTGAVYEVDPEKAVRCKLLEGGSMKGFIQSFSDDAMVVNGQTISFQEIEVLSSWHTRKNSSAKTGGILLTSLGGLLTVGGAVVVAESTKPDEEVGTVVVGVPLGIVATAVGIGTTYLGIRALKRKRFDLMEWDIRVRSY